MSFSSDVKKELTQQISSSRHCKLAELGALVAMTAKIQGGEIIFDAEQENVINKVAVLQRSLKIDIYTPEGKQAVKLLDTEKKRCIVDRMLIERNCCKQSYLRGAFLAAGSVTNPEKGYHFEIVCECEEHARILIDIIKDFGLEPKYIQRKKYFVVYIKDGSMIVDVLNIMGAHISLMNMENVRILKDMRNSVNRRVNCETANINKTVNAALRQLEDIRYIEATKGLKYLPDNLRKVAELRLEEEETPLKELGEKLNPPIGKSGINHRLRKISEIASELRRNEND